jgi:uncharacterized membrane protein YdbT with pleckstrin-like domain
MIGPQLDLMPHERMVLYAHPHWWFFWKQALGGVAILAVFMLRWVVGETLATLLWWVVILGLVVWLVDTIYEFVQWQTTRFAITTERVSYQHGLVRQHGVSIPLNRINNVNFSQSLIARMLNNGIVTIESAGETGDSVFENIPDPSHVRSVIFEQIQADEQADSERDAAALAQVMQQQAHAPASTRPSAEERLQRLQQLHEQGLVSDDEYARKRAQILEDL